MTEVVPPVDPDVLLAEAGFVRGPARGLLRNEAQVDDVTRQTRVASRTIPESGETLFSPLPVGRYAVGIDREGLRVTVDVKGPGARATLP